jgi:hypothetical protein
VIAFVGEIEAGNNGAGAKGGVFGLPGKPDAVFPK